MTDYKNDVLCLSGSDRPQRWNCLEKWLNYEINEKPYMSYGIGVAKTDGDNIRTLAHTDILQTKDL